MALDVLSYAKPIASEVIKLIVRASLSYKKTLKIDERNIEEALVQHLRKVENFTSEVGFREIGRPKSLLSIYIPLDTTLIKKEKGGNGFDKRSNLASEVIKNSIDQSINPIIVGEPGSGKTTTIKYICQKLLHDENFLGENFQYPILVRFREDEINNNEVIPLFEYILNVYGIIVENTIKCSDPKDDKNQLDGFKKQAAIKILNQQKPLIILDGLDEVANSIIREKILKNIEELSLKLDSARFILTTRKGDDNFHIPNTEVFELAPLNELQIIDFSRQWLGNDKVKSFLTQLYQSSVHDSAKRPLTLAHLCALFEREGKIPEKSKSIYRKIVNLLIQDWNFENKIHLETKFSDFDPDRKREFLENLAFELSVNFNKTQFTRDDLEKCYTTIHIKFNLPMRQMPEVLNEIQVHNGLITQSSYNQFEFAHKSFQEYLAAEHIVRLPKLPIDKNLFSVPNEMALAVTLSSEPDVYLCVLLDEYLLPKNINFDFLSSFTTRLAIEKPDFMQTSQLGVSVLKLIDKYTRNIYHQDTKAKILHTSFSNLFEIENLKMAVREVVESCTVLVDTLDGIYKISSNEDGSSLNANLNREVKITKETFEMILQNGIE